MKSIEERIAAKRQKRWEGRMAARAEYSKAMNTALEMAQRLAEKLDEMDRDLTPKNWADVNDAHRTIESLKEINDRIFNEGEYAPENN